jgi:hypothetical protein
MTRQEFDENLAATQDTTEGYTNVQLSEINDTVFEQVRELDIEAASDMWEKSRIDHMFERAMASY